MRVWHEEQTGLARCCSNTWRNVADVPAEMLAAAQRHRAALVELAVEQDEAAMVAYLYGEEPSAEVLRACIRQGVLAGAFVPVLAGSAYRQMNLRSRVC